jgi:hypothetical protein
VASFPAIVKNAKVVRERKGQSVFIEPLVNKLKLLTLPTGENQGYEKTLGFPENKAQLSQVQSRNRHPNQVTTRRATLKDLQSGRGLCQMIQIRYVQYSMF